MGNLGDALKKAGLISEKDLRRQQHEQRVHRKQVGREGLAEEEKLREDRRRQRRDEQRSADREREVARREALAKTETRAQAIDLIRGHSVNIGRGGDRRFHYVDKSGRIPYLRIGLEVSRRLEAGELGIVSDGNEACVVPRDVAQRTRELAPDLLIMLNGGAG